MLNGFAGGYPRSSLWLSIWNHSRVLGDSLLLVSGLAIMRALIAWLDLLLHWGRGILAAAVGVFTLLVVTPMTLVGIAFLIREIAESFR